MHHDEPSAEILGQASDLWDEIAHLALEIEALPGADRDLRLIGAEFACKDAGIYVQRFLRKFAPPQPPAEPGALAVTVIWPRIAENEISLVVARLKAQLDAIAAAFPDADLNAAQSRLMHVAYAPRKDSRIISGTQEIEELARLRLECLPLLLAPARARSHLAAIAASATTWSEVQAAWHDYGLICDRSFAAESIWLMKWQELGAAAVEWDQACLCFGVSRGNLSTAIDAYLPHANPKAQSFSHAYRQELRTFRRSQL